MSAAFVLVCAPKGLEMGEDHKLHRASQVLALQEELTAVLEPVQALAAAHGCALKFMEGAVIATIGEAVSIDSFDDRVCVFQGYLKNLPQLVAKYKNVAPHDPHVVKASPRNSSQGGTHDEPAAAQANGSAPAETAAAPAEQQAAASAAATPAISPAEVILAMYEADGVALLTRLQGKFSFVMYDAKQMRVLAARDGSGAVPLLQARTARDGLVIASQAPMLACCHDTLEFQPGFFKYGWHAEPRLFTATDGVLQPTGASARRSLDHGHHSPAQHSHHGRRRHSVDMPAGSQGAQHGSKTPNGTHRSPTRNSSGNGAAVSSSLPTRMKRMSLDHPTSGGQAGLGGVGSPSGVIGSPGGGCPRSVPPRHSGGKGRKDAHPPAQRHTNFNPAGSAANGGASQGAASSGLAGSAGQASHKALNADAAEFVPRGIAAQ